MGQIIEIEVRKSILSKGQYSSMQSLSGTIALNLIDCISIISVLIKDFEKKLKIKTPSELPIDTALELNKLYIEKISDWYYSIIQLLNPDFNQVDEDKNEILEG